MIGAVAAVEATGSRGENIQHWIRKLVVYIPNLTFDRVHHWLASVFTLIGYTSRLEHLHLFPCAFEILAYVAQTTPASLKVLDVNDFSIGRVLSGFSLAPFTALVRLSVYMVNIDLDREDQALFDPCSMPHLQALNWQGHSSTGFFHFLSSSTFGALNDVELRNLAPLSDITRPQLQAFLQKNAMDELSLTLASPDELADVIPSVRAASLMPMCGPEGAIPPASIIDQLPASVKTLELHGVIHHVGLWPILEAIKASKSCELTTIGILTTGPGELFTWVQQRQHNGPPDETHLRESALVGNLLQYAIALAQRGIEMVDRRGYTVYDYFPYSDD
jgi:hypothetical protein